VGEGGHLVVASDFADASDWAGAVATARAEGLTVDLRQINGGGQDNVGIVERSFRSGEAVVTVENTGDSTASRTVSSGDARERVTLQPGDVETVTLPVPAGGGRIELSPRDSRSTTVTGSR
jgi:electron transfer flavoprotein alpha subunit